MGWLDVVVDSGAREMFFVWLTSSVMFLLASVLTEASSLRASSMYVSLCEVCQMSQLATFAQEENMPAS